MEVTAYVLELVQVGNHTMRFERSMLTLCLLLSIFFVGGCAGRGEREGVRSAEPVAEIESQAELESAAAERITREQTLMASLTIFVLAIFVGFELITKVPPTLHTPLMSGSNAISGITLVGAALMAANDQSGWAAFFGLLAVIMATVNVIGGFMVTDRMLGMFKRK